jgi:hypothetical protein
MRLPGTLVRLGALLAVGGFPAPASASWLDSDFYCRVYGCVVVHDGFSFDVYDVYRFSNGGEVPPGQPLIPWSGNPFQGSGRVNPVITGTRTEGFYAAPVREEGVQLAVDTNGNGRANLEIGDDGDGVLDAGDTLSPFTLDRRTEIVAEETSAQRSFYLSSRTDFYLAAEVVITTPGGGLSEPSALDQIALDYRIRNAGNDDGMRFGQAAQSNRWRSFSVDSLGELYGQPAYLGEFTGDIRRRNANTVAEQSVRFDYVYGFEGYDLSMGAGLLSYRIEFTFINR